MCNPGEKSTSAWAHVSCHMVETAKRPVHVYFRLDVNRSRF